MDTRTISEGFREQIGTGKKVVAALFTTYNFEPDFFEQEVIPLMLDQELAYSSDARIKRIQVREALGQTGLPIEVFYDLDIFRQQQPVSPAMEYLHHGIRGEKYAFHAKLVLLLLEDQSSEQVLCIGAGSANLTGAGWWENIECQHWETVAPREVSRRFLRQLRNDLDWLAGKRSGIALAGTSALDLIRQYLTDCRASNSTKTVSYYGLTSHSLQQASRPAFIRFLVEAQKEQCGPYNQWSLEIISPYFAETADFDAHEHFFDCLKVKTIRIFLPFNDQGEALCHQDYYERLFNDRRIEWATWAPEIANLLGAANGHRRKTHAKIYHFHNGKQSWAFVGSVNFTQRAISDNQEAGFFVKLPPGITLLKAMKSVPEKWCAETELAGSDEEFSPDQTLPMLSIFYDWKVRCLAIGIQGDAKAFIDVLNPERQLVLNGVEVTSQASAVECDMEVIEKMLSGSGFLRIAGRWADGRAFAEHVVLVQQTNWTHKPLDLPTLTPAEIMQIYAGLNAIRRNQVIEYLKGRELKDKGLGGEMSGASDFEEQGRQFFAEYAELFHAFRNLRRRLADDWKAERFSQVDYYLSGRGIDSLPTLLGSLYEQDRNLDAVTIYLTLLCLIQIYQQPGYDARPQVSQWLAHCQENASSLEASGQLMLIDANSDRSTRFFRWYRDQFFRDYQYAGGEAGDAHTAH
jgi:hypothetical protein